MVIWKAGVSETMFNLGDGDAYCYFNRYYLILKFNECQCVLEGRFDCSDRVEPRYFAPRFPFPYFLSTLLCSARAKGESIHSGFDV